MPQTQTLPSISLKFKISVDGVVKLPQNVDPRTASNILTNPYKFKGFVKYLAKQYLLERYNNLPGGFIKGIYRHLDHQESDPQEYLRIAASPFSQMFGFPIKNCQWFAVSKNVDTTSICKLIMFMMQPPRIRVVVQNQPRIQLVSYTQGVRDDSGTAATENPHEIKFAKILDPVEVTMSIVPTSFDYLTVPEWAVAPVTPGKPYAEAYKTLANAIAERLKNLPPTLSPFGGRAYHTLKIESVEVTEGQVQVPPPAGDLHEILNPRSQLAALWRQLPQYYRNTYSVQQRQQRHGW